MIFHVFDKGSKKLVFNNGAGVTNKNKLSSCSGDSNIQSPFLHKKPKVLVLVRPNHRDDNYFFFSTLETINGFYFQIWVFLQKICIKNFNLIKGTFIHLRKI